MPRLPDLHEADLHEVQFLAETGLMLEQARGEEEDIPIAPVVAPFEHGKPFVTEEQEMSLGMQMLSLHFSDFSVICFAF